MEINEETSRNNELNILHKQPGVKIVDQNSLENQIQKEAEEKLKEKNLQVALTRLERVETKIKKLEANLNEINSSRKATRGQQNKVDQLSLKLSETRQEKAEIIEYLKIDQRSNNNENELELNNNHDSTSSELLEKWDPYNKHIVPQDTESIQNSEINATTRKKRKHSKSIEDSEDSYSESDISDSDKQSLNSAISKSNSKKAKSKSKGKNEFDYQDDMDQNTFNSRIELWKSTKDKSQDIDFQIGRYRLPAYISDKLFPYQKKAIHWMWELHNQKVGGILGDEMGLGKTVQIVSFLSGLHYSNMSEQKALIICPATLQQQWVREFHKWYPPLRIVILKSKSIIKNNESLENDDGKNRYKFNTNFNSKLNKIMRFADVLVTTYDTVRIHQKVMATKQWGYVILDEGHKIRNPDVEVTLSCKKLNTPHRLILSGTPIQNSLIDLWSLFDFVYPGRLGTLPLFQQHFCEPIKLASLASATQLQVRTSYECARSLKDLIAPYLLRRLKSDVAIELPKKTEQVIFCQLSKLQYSIYESFINSKEVDRIISGKQHVLSGIDTLRKICNHPNLLKNKYYNDPKSDLSPKKSGKLGVTQLLLESWYDQGLKSLIFFQTKQMLNIVENMVQNIGIPYLRMDGDKQVKDRMTLVDKFNTDPSISVFLLTTRVGGLGLNLTSAVRVIIYDPDWNPSTDLQARERAWRLGQTQEVTVYRLMTAGTIEERIYHRQIYKQYLTNKILKDPTQREFFHAFSLTELFAHPSMSGDKAEDSKHHDLHNNPNNLTNELRETVVTNDDNIIKSSNQVIDTERYISRVKESSTDSSSEGSILNSLLDISGAKKVINSDTVLQSNYLKDDAQRNVKNSLDILKSFQNTNKLNTSAPTWTGKSGSIGKPKNDNTFDSNIGGYSKVKSINSGTIFGKDSFLQKNSSNSTSLLSQLQSSSPITHKNIGNVSRPSIYQSTISLYLKKHGGKVAFSKIIDDFKDNLTNDEQTKEFRKELKRQTTFVKDKSFAKSMCVANWFNED